MDTGLDNEMDNRLDNELDDGMEWQFTSTACCFVTVAVCWRVLCYRKVSQAAKAE